MVCTTLGSRFWINTSPLHIEPVSWFNVSMLKLSTHYPYATQCSRQTHPFDAN